MSLVRSGTPPHHGHGPAAVSWQPHPAITPANDQMRLIRTLSNDDTAGAHNGRSAYISSRLTGRYGAH